ncbi:MAG: hydantoinase B/oxoprolinase family protein [Cyanobacteria bacterium P01_D01_bin.105]
MSIANKGFAPLLNTYSPWGIFGGEDGIPGGVEAFHPDDDDVQVLPSKFPCRKTKTGDTLCTISPCGGGYGNPLERDPVSVLEDVLNEFLTVESARRDYSVVIDPITLEIDQAETSSLRLEGRELKKRVKRSIGYGNIVEPKTEGWTSD